MATIRSIFGDYANRLQLVIDSRLDAFDPTWFGQYFDFDTPQMGLTFEDAIGRARVEAAASVIARGSAAPLRARPGLEKLKGSIPAIAEKFQMLEEDWRNYHVIQALAVSDDVKKQQLLRLLFDDVRKAGNSLMKRIDYMVLEGVSTGKVTITTTNNPDGMVATDIDLLMTSGNKTNAAINWATAATASPIKDIQTVVSYQKGRGVSIQKILMSDAAWQKFIATTDVKDTMKVFNGQINNKILPTLDNVNQFMVGQRLPVIEIVDVVIGVEKDGVTTQMRPFNDNNVVFVPAGRLGSIKNAIPIEQLHPVPQVQYAQFNNGLISKWADNEPFSEWTKGEINAFPSISQIDSMHILSTTVAF